MATLRSSTVFRLLCAAIGVLSLGLLSMVGVMVYPSLVNGDSSAKGPVVKPQTHKMIIKAKEVPVEQDLANLSEFLYPAPKAGDLASIWDRATEDFGGWKLIGLAAEDENKGYAFLQHMGDNRTLVLGVGETARKPDDMMKLDQIHNGMVQLTFNNTNTGALKRTGGVPGLAGLPAAPTGGYSTAMSPGSSTYNYAALGVPATPTTPAAPAPPPTSRVSISGRMVGSPPAVGPGPSPSMMPSGPGPDTRTLMRRLGGRNRPNGNNLGVGGANNGP